MPVSTTASPSCPTRLAAACPKGIDVYFENVGGAVLAAAMPLLNVGARIPVCGLIAWYNLDELPAGVDRIPMFLSAVLRKRREGGGLHHLRPLRAAGRRSSRT